MTRITNTKFKLNAQPRVFSLEMSQSMLILTETTLFFHDLRFSKTNKSMSGSLPLADWVSQVEAQPLRKPSTIRTATSVTARSNSTLRTTSTANTAISSTSRRALKPDDKPDCRPNQEEEVGLFEESEEAEYQAALRSPVKGKKRLTNAVRIFVTSVDSSFHASTIGYH